MSKEIVPFERHEGGVTPDAAYNIGYFYDKDDRPCNKEDAVRINIVEYNADGERIQETYAIVSK